MPAIFKIARGFYSSGLSFEVLKCYVIFFLNFILFLYTFILFFIVALMYTKLGFGGNNSYKHRPSSSFNNKKTGTRFYSTSSKNLNTASLGSSTPETKRKTLSSSEARSYEDLYKGRGIPISEPIWVRDNGKERSPFGASWAKEDKKDRLDLPSKYKHKHVNIKDPFNNRNLIKDTCRGNRVVYIWTYLPTGICLVGSSSNSVERVLSYFFAKHKKYLFLYF